MTAMTLDELIDKLTELRDEIDRDEGLAGIDNAGDLPITVAIQPHYPIAVDLDKITVLIDGEKGPRVWIATGGSPYDINPYAPRQAWEGDIVYPDMTECVECEGDGCDACLCTVCNGEGCLDCESTGREGHRRELGARLRWGASA